MKYSQAGRFNEKGEREKRPFLICPPFNFWRCASFLYQADRILINVKWLCDIDWGLAGALLLLWRGSERWRSWQIEWDLRMFCAQGFGVGEWGIACIFCHFTLPAKQPVKMSHGRGQMPGILMKEMIEGIRWLLLDFFVFYQKRLITNKNVYDIWTHTIIVQSYISHCRSELICGSNSETGILLVYGRPEARERSELARRLSGLLLSRWERNVCPYFMPCALLWQPHHPDRPLLPHMSRWVSTLSLNSQAILNYWIRRHARTHGISFFGTLTLYHFYISKRFGHF